MFSAAKGFAIKICRKEERNMQKIILIINEMFANFTCRAAASGAGLASWFGWHQPKVPEKLAK